MSKEEVAEIASQGGYTVGKVLGQGAFGKVVLVEKDSLTAACKIVKKPKIAAKLQVVFMEAKILKALQHQYIVRCFDAIDTADHMYFIMELMSGGELFDRIVSLGHFTEKMAQDVTFKLLSALQFMHEQGVCHRDLKPENLLLSDTSETAEVKITDFGLSKMLDERTTIMKTACGTPGYCAPEVLNMGNYGFECDVWSYGVILYILLCGFPPFYGDNDQQMFKKIKGGQYRFLKPYWDPISDDAKDIVAKMLVVDVTDRTSIAELLQHPWLAGERALFGGTRPRRSRRGSLQPDLEGVNLMTAHEYPIQQTAKKMANARLRKAILTTILVTLRLSSDDSEPAPEAPAKAPTSPVEKIAAELNKAKNRACACCVQ